MPTIDDDQPKRGYPRTPGPTPDDRTMTIPNHTGVGTTVVLAPDDVLEQERRKWWPQP